MQFQSSGSVRSRPSPRTALGRPLLRRRHRPDAADTPFTYSSIPPQGRLAAVVPRHEPPQVGAFVDRDRVLAGARLALRERRSAVFSASQTSPGCAPPEHRLTRKAADRGLALPIQVHGKAWGVLVLYARRESALAARAIQRLTDLASDLGCRLGALRDQRDQCAAAQALRQANLELQARLRDQSADLARTARALQAIRHSIAHDLRAPLRSIDGFAHVLSSRYASSLNLTARGYLERMRCAAQRLGAILDHILHLGHLANIRPRLGKVDLSALASAICTELGRADKQRRVQVHIEPRLVAHADAALMRVALRHLLENAWEHTRPVAEAAIHFGFARGDDGTPFYFVRDNGTGFDMRHSGQLFQPFSRLGVDTNSPRMGTGLATVARIIELHGGTIWASSSPGQGATFSFALPLPK